MSKTLEVGVTIIPKELSVAATRALDAVLEYDWILFTSKNTVAFFAKEMSTRGLKDVSGIRIAAVGPETVSALAARGWQVDAMPKQYTGRAMVQSLGNVKRLRILFPRSAVAPQEPIHILRAKGALVRVVPMYYPVPIPLTPSEKRALTTGLYSTLSFKSPSGIQGFLKQLNTREKEIALQIPAVCIGPTTRKAAKKAGFRHVSQTVL